MVSGEEEREEEEEELLLLVLLLIRLLLLLLRSLPVTLVDVSSLKSPFILTFFPKTSRGIGGNEAMRRLMLYTLFS
jgi:hypothetical protein